MSGWLYLPHMLQWFNPDHIIIIAGGSLYDDGPLTYYGIVTTAHPHEEYEVTHPDDVAAVAKWMEGRA